MKFHQHNFERIEDYLHHRPPYLLVEEIAEMGDESITTIATVSDDAFFIQGHFPGTSILPGAMMQEMSTQSAGILIAGRFNPMSEYNTHDPFFNEYALGVLVKVKFSRFKGFARPGDRLTIHIQLEERIDQVFDFAGRIKVEDKTVMQNRFQLTNILSKTLQGVE